MTTASTRRPTEAQCQTAIVHAARVAGWLTHHARAARQQSGRWATPLQGDAGFTDLVLVHPKRHQVLFVELKRKPNRIEPAQERWHTALRAAGLDVRVCWVPEEMDDLLATIVGRPR